ncbi:MAG: ferredoxin reductase [Acidimicrobiia bacterium]
MAGTAIPGRLTWLVGEVVAIIDENPTVRSIVFDCPGWPGHRAGQHIDLRLTAEDGYVAERSYSMANAPAGQNVTITVELVADGEVSPYLIEELRVGDRVELRGPIGGYFVWDHESGAPLMLIGGGSGVVPLMAIVRSRVSGGSSAPIRYLASARSHDRLIYVAELDQIVAEDRGVEVVHTLTRSHPESWRGPTRRIDREMIATHGFGAGDNPLCFVCGPTAFVETVATTLIELGHRPDSIKTERFGPTGG